MVFAEKPDAKEEDFVSLLERTREFLIAEIENINPDSSTFEVLVFEMMKKAAIGTVFDGTIRHTGDHVFPDIMAENYFGVEVKMTIADKWTSIGNSVLESLRDEKAERIYIMFGKMGGKKDIKYRLYQECLPDVSVTHSPRYKIDMQLDKGKSIFEKLGVEYESLRREANPIGKFKKYYKSKLNKGEELWWIDKDESPVIRKYNLLSEEEKKEFLLDCFILFPEIFGKKWTKYERPAGYLITKFNAFTSSFRDKFSAGGAVTRKFKGIEYRIPRMADNLFLVAKEVETRLERFDKDELESYWAKEINHNVVDVWKGLIDKEFETFGLNLKLSDVYESGLNEN